MRTATVQQNLIFGLDGLPKRDKTQIADHYTEMVGLKGFEQAFPYQLSGGMLKRVEVARALAVKSQILYMDEPFATLDALTRVRMRQELLQILSRERHTVLLVTHDVEEAIQLADRILILSSRPAKIQSILNVRLPHPRKLSTPSFVAMKERVLQELGL